MIWRYLATNAGTSSARGPSGSTRAVPSKITIPPPRPLPSRCSETRGFAAMWPVFLPSLRLKTRNSWPSHRNQTGVGFGWPDSVTVVSQMMSSSRSRPAAAAWTGFPWFSIADSLSSGSFRLGPHAFEYRRDGLGRLGAGDPVPAVDDEEGDAAHAERPGHLLVGVDRLPVFAAGQDGQRLVAVQTHVGRETGERGVVEDRGLIGKVRAVQPLGQLGLPAPCPGQMQQPVRVPGVAAAQILHAEGQPGLGGSLLHLPLGLAGLFQAQPVLAGQPLDRRGGDPGRR